MNSKEKPNHKKIPLFNILARLDLKDLEVNSPEEEKKLNKELDLMIEEEIQQKNEA